MKNINKAYIGLMLFLPAGIYAPCLFDILTVKVNSTYDFKKNILITHATNPNGCIVFR